MIRKAIAGTLFLAALATLVLCLNSRCTAVSWQNTKLPVPGRHTLHVFSGRAQLERLSEPCPHPPSPPATVKTVLGAGWISETRFDCLSAREYVSLSVEDARIVARQGPADYLGNTYFLVKAHTLTVPLWMPFVLFAAYPALAFIRGPVRRWRRRKRGLCTHCGYNLTGLTEPRCPECGERILCGV